MELDCDRKCLEKDKPGTGVGSLQLCLVGYGNPGASPNSRTGEIHATSQGEGSDRFYRHLESTQVVRDGLCEEVTSEPRSEEGKGVIQVARRRKIISNMKEEHGQRL